jgi:hypothetical protein
MAKLNNQHFLIIEYLKQGHTLTPIEAIKVAGSMKLSTRVGELRKLGYDIKNEWLKLENGKKVKRYWLAADKIAQISPKEAQGCTNTPELGKGVFQAPKPTEGLETQNSSPVYFEKEGQLAFLG